MWACVKKPTVHAAEGTAPPLSTVPVLQPIRIGRFTVTKEYSPEPPEVPCHSKEDQLPIMLPRCGTASYTQDRTAFSSPQLPTKLTHSAPATAAISATSEESGGTGLQGDSCERLRVTSFMARSRAKSTFVLQRAKRAMQRLGGKMPGQHPEAA
eukprot:TRINITY_DN75923_c0_g1_i1.p1 TRINITY_DN75923_c0_g1~~TRINITY_DN75923_c0_g1_i1.p1  ORF type:complete len:154 (+),score=23.10 TRINITY_DN75923_c0_g1_i1:76-537(+)